MSPYDGPSEDEGKGTGGKGEGGRRVSITAGKDRSLITEEDGVCIPTQALTRKGRLKRVI